MSRLLRAAACALALTLAAHAQTPVTSTPTQHDKHAAAKAYLAGAHAIEERNTRAAYDSFSKAARSRSHQHRLQKRRRRREGPLRHRSHPAGREGAHPRQGTMSPTRASPKRSSSIPPTPSSQQHIGDVAGLDDSSIKPDDITSSIADAIRLEPTPANTAFISAPTASRCCARCSPPTASRPASTPASLRSPVRFDVDDVDFHQAEQMLRLETDTFFVPLDPHRVLVAKDTRANRQEYERLLLETVYLPGLTSQELTDVSNLARNVLEITQVVADPTQNTMTVRGPESRLALFNRTLHGLMDGRSQVLLEVRIYEISRTHNTNIGVQTPQQFNAFNLNSEIQQVLNGNQSPDPADHLQRPRQCQ